MPVLCVAPEEVLSVTKTTREEFLGNISQALTRHQVRAPKPDPVEGPVYHRLADLSPEALADHFHSQAPIRHFSSRSIQAGDLAEALQDLLSRDDAEKVVICDDAVSRALHLAEAVTAAGRTPLVYRPDGYDHQGLVDALANADVGITVPTYGLADVGAVVEMASREIPKSFSLLPRVHVSLLPLSRLYSSMSTLAEELEKVYARDGLTSGMNQISGPSSTGDIESYMVTGAHGPVEEHIFIIMDL